MITPVPVAFALGPVLSPAAPPPLPALLLPVVRVQEDPPAAPAGGQQPADAIEFALSTESFDLGFEHSNPERHGSLELGVLGTEDDDLSFDARFLRTGGVAGSAFTFGAGLGAYAVFIDQPDAEAYAITLCGDAAYGFDVGIPAEVGVELAWAPDVTTFDDGDELLDGQIRFRVELSDFAAAFVGYRFLEVDVGRDVEVQDNLHLGIRMSI